MEYKLLCVFLCLLTIIHEGNIFVSNDGWLDGKTGGWMDGWMDGWIIG
jgi:hypothetical protein